MEQSFESNYRQIIKDYQLIIYKVCNLYVSDKSPLDELYQETMINIWRGLPHFNNESKLSTWIYRISINTCISYNRKYRTRIDTMGLTDEIVNQLSEMDDEKKTMIHRMYRLIDGLNNLDKSIILLYLEDKNYDEIAEIIGLTPTNVGSKINRIKDRLKKMNAKMNMEE